MPSSVVALAQYFDSTHVLRVIFVSGKIYDYKNVPTGIYQAMKSAASKGKYFNKHIKGNYEFEKIVD